MSWTDRDYNQEQRGGWAMGTLRTLFLGSVPLGSLFNIRIRVHAMLLWVIGLVLVFGLGQGFTWQDRVISMSMLFTIVLLHEFGHCFAARAVGGEANEIMMTPLGGLAMAYAPRQPKAQFITVACGPLVNVLICLVCGVMLHWAWGWLPWNPFPGRAPAALLMHHGWGVVAVRFAYWVYLMSLGILLFNLLPIFPLDGGQLLQSGLWWWTKLGYFRSLYVTVVVGMVGAGILTVVGIVTQSVILTLIAIQCYLACAQTRAQLQANGPEAYTDDDLDFSHSLHPDSPARKRRKLNKRAIRRAQRQAAADQAEQERIDLILAKVSAHGMPSLSWRERRVLHRATERRRQRDAEMSTRVER